MDTGNDPTKDLEDDINPDKEEKYLGGVLVFKAGDKLDIIDNHVIGEDAASRCVYIGDYIYAIDDFDEITAFKYAG